MRSNKSPLIVLGIETSCDETAVAIISVEEGNIRVLSNIVSSQAKLHALWGGIVPNLTAREHLKNIVPVLKLGLAKSRISSCKIALIAATQGPGLIPALLIGGNFAKTLAYVWQKPLLGIHHIEGHIYANFINKDDSISNSQLSIPKHKKIRFPVLCLVVSGGHTQLVLMKKHLDYKIVGETLDDAAGEAFDKVARILRLGYPGGPAIATEAAKFKLSNSKFKISLPRPMINSNNLNFSFSGLKTAVLYAAKKNHELLKDENYVIAMCHEFQQSVTDILVSKTLKAAKIYRPRTIMLAGGVSANTELRSQLGEAIGKNIPTVDYKMPDTKYCIDNAAMVAAAAGFRWNNMDARQRKKMFHNWKLFQPDARLKLK